jgi:hypothetical protein
VPVSEGMLKGLLAGAAALAAALAARWLLPGSFQLAGGLTTIIAVYVGVVLALGLSKEDTMVLRSVRAGRAAA